MICVIDGLPCTRECEICRVEEIKESGCIIDGLDCDNCGRCDEIANGEWNEVRCTENR